MKAGAGAVAIGVEAANGPDVVHVGWFDASAGTAAHRSDTWRARLAGQPGVDAFPQIGPAPVIVVLSTKPVDVPEGLTRQREGIFRRWRYERSPEPGLADFVGFLLCVQLFVPDLAGRDDVRRWLDEEHVDRQVAVRGTHWYAGYESTDEDEDFSFLNLWGITSPQVIETPEWATARDTAWRARLMSVFARIERAVFELSSTDKGTL